MSLRPVLLKARLAPRLNNGCLTVVYRINDECFAAWPKEVSCKFKQRQAGCGQGLGLGTSCREEPPPPHLNSILCPSPGLLFLGRATHHMSGGCCCWDDVTVYFEGHTGASVSLASHTLHVSSLRAGDTHKSTNSA